MELQKSIKEAKAVNPKGIDASVILFIVTGISTLHAKRFRV